MVNNELRQACARVTRTARSVRVRTAEIPAYAASLPEPPPLSAAVLLTGRQRTRAAWYWLTLDAINFGSGWFPTLAKAPGTSGYRTIASGLAARFDRSGPWSAAELSALTAAEIATVLGQDPGHELMALFAVSLNDLGSHLEADHAGDPLALIASTGSSAPTLVARLADWDCFRDVSRYGELDVPFLKRAQIAAADLARSGASQLAGLDELTMFADNLVPHVLRLDGILEFAPGLVERIETEALIEHGSAEEIEIRAAGVHAVELIVAAWPDRRVGEMSAGRIDQLLWDRGQSPRYKARPRHRSRCTAY